jgi:phthalate 4,5-dioxygenase
MRPGRPIMRKRPTRARNWQCPEHVHQTTFRSKANRDNTYLIDRVVQKTETFTGIDGINVQDRAIQESMGPICNRSREHLGPADKAIIQMRRLLREAINTVRAGGTPAGVAPSYYNLYCALQVLPRDADWRHILAPDISPENILQTV